MISDKLDYLNETKQLIKQAIINKGQDIPDDATFRSYVDKINNISGGETKGDVKLFETINEMKEDTSAKEGDLAIVYRNEIQNVKEGDISSTIICPSTITLSEPLTDMIWFDTRSDDYSVDLRLEIYENNARMEIRNMDTGDEISIYWETTDNQKWVSTSEYCDKPIDLGTELTFASRYEPWNDTIGYFIQTGGNYFEGMYEYSDKSDEDWYNTITSITLQENEFISTNEQTYLPTLKTLIDKMTEELMEARHS